MLPGFISVCMRLGRIKAHSTVLISDTDYDSGFYERLHHCQIQYQWWMSVARFYMHTFKSRPGLQTCKNSEVFLPSCFFSSIKHPHVTETGGEWKRWDIICFNSYLTLINTFTLTRRCSRLGGGGDFHTFTHSRLGAAHHYQPLQHFIILPTCFQNFSSLYFLIHIILLVFLLFLLLLLYSIRFIFLTSANCS